MRSLKLVMTLGLILFGCSFAAAQSPAPGTQTFSSADVSFDYPSGWKATEQASDQMRQINVVPDHGNAFIIIVIYRSPVQLIEEFDQLKEQISKPLDGKIAAGFSTYSEAGECIQFRGKKIPGQILKGIYRKEPSASSSFSVVADKKFIHFLYVREDQSSAATDAGWHTIMESLNIKGGDPGARAMFDNESDVVLNGKAIKLPIPRPLESSSYSETIKVWVVIDEGGNVISAKALSGQVQAYKVAAQDAAKHAKFLPTIICGEPTKVSGRIDYNFLPAAWNPK